LCSIIFWCDVSSWACFLHKRQHLWMFFPAILQDLAYLPRPLSIPRSFPSHSPNQCPFIPFPFPDCHIICTQKNITEQSIYLVFHACLLYL
jgi:hypothetical protein